MSIIIYVYYEIKILREKKCMKNWVKPQVEELRIGMTANYVNQNHAESCPARYNPDYICNCGARKPEKNAGKIDPFANIS